MPAPLLESNYPFSVEQILVAKCATAGCHNSQSKDGAGGLELTDWNKLFEGSRSGAVVIPFRSDFSTLCYYTNIDTGKGLVLLPTMPYNAPSLTSDEYNTLRSWIQEGAPDKNGFVKFSDYQSKSKLYVSNRGCDVVTVLDPETGLAMRFVDVGNAADIEGPCMVKVAPDKLHWYVIFNQGTTIQKFRCADNVKVGELVLGSGFWTSLVISSDSKKGYISNADFNGSIVNVDLEQMVVNFTYQNNLRYPYGLCLNPDNSKLYATSKEGNFIYKLDLSNPWSPLVEEISLETGVPVNTSISLNPYTILFNADGSCYYVVCNKSAELRIMQTATDSLLKTFVTGSNPYEITYSLNYPYLFVSCLGVPGGNKKSVINVFNYNSQTFVVDINAGYDSKGMVVDETSGKLFVANRNVSAGSPAAHHAPVCAGKNGFISAISLSNLQLVNGYKAELSVDPYHIAE